MKVSEAIKMLGTNYNPDEEIVILWWDSDGMSHYTGTEVSDEAMAHADEKVSESEWEQNRISDIIFEAIEQYEQDRKESN